jgi:hypothetical protein
MSISTPPPPAPPRKSGMGCFGCGCSILVILFLLLAGLVAGCGYLIVKTYQAVTSETAADIPAPPPDQNLVISTQRKLADFDHDVKNHQPATISLSAEELNAMIANNPDVIKNNVRVFLSLDGDKGRVQATAPTSALGHVVTDGRSLNIDSSFRIHFDTGTKNIIFEFNTLHMGKMTLIGAPAEDESTNGGFLQGLARGFSQSFGPSFNQSFNAGLKKNPDTEAFLNQTKTVEIQNGQLVIKTQ